MRIVVIAFLLAILTTLHAKRHSKTIRLKDFPREGPYVFLTKMLLGSGQAQVDITYQYALSHTQQARGDLLLILLLRRGHRDGKPESVPLVFAALVLLRQGIPNIQKITIQLQAGTPGHEALQDI